MKRKISIFLCALILTQLAACGEASDDPKVTTPPADAGTTEPAETGIPDDLPESDLEGYEFRILGFGDSRFAAIYVDEQNGSLVNDAVYNKCKTVEDRFGCKIVLAGGSTVGGTTSTSEEGSVIAQSILAGDDTFDIVSAHDITMANLSLQGMFVNMYDVNYVNFNKPWWPKYTVESLTFNGAMYLFSNSLSYNNMSDTRVLFFNKSMLDDLKIEYPYQSVYDGNWTLDALGAITKQGCKDLNGDGKQGDEDQYGIVNPNYYYCVLEPFNIEPYQKENDQLVYKIDLDKYQTIVEKFYALFFGEGGRVFEENGGATTAFAENRAIFTYGQMSDAINTYSQTNISYGILPMPKLDENQTQYFGGCTDRPLAIPITADSHLDTTGLIVEALSAEGYRQVFPAYFEQALKVRYADQTDDANMIDIINENVILSFTYMYGNFNSSYNNMLYKLFAVNNPSTDVASYAASIQSEQEERVKYIAQQFEDMKK